MKENSRKSRTKAKSLVTNCEIITTPKYLGLKDKKDKEDEANRNNSSK